VKSDVSFIHDWQICIALSLLVYLCYYCNPNACILYAIQLYKLENCLSNSKQIILIDDKYIHPVIVYLKHIQFISTITDLFTDKFMLKSKCMDIWYAIEIPKSYILLWVDLKWIWTAWIHTGAVDRSEAVKLLWQ